MASVDLSVTSPYLECTLDLNSHLLVFVGQKYFGMILGGFGEAKNLDFRTFIVIFSKQILKDVLESQKIEKKTAKTKKIAIFGRPGGMCGGPGER